MNYWAIEYFDKQAGMEWLRHVPGAHTALMMGAMMNNAKPGGNTVSFPGSQPGRMAGISTPREPRMPNVLAPSFNSAMILPR